MLRTLTAVLLILALWSEASFADETTKGVRLDDFYIKIPFGSFPGNVRHDYLNPPRGTIEFWFKPEWGNRTNRHLFFWGAASNRESISIQVVKSTHLVFQIALRNYKKYVVREKAFKMEKNNSWRHLACCWDLEDAETVELSVFLDGRPLNRGCSVVHAERPFIPLDPIPTPLFLGTGKKLDKLVTEVSPRFRLAQFRISNLGRYKKKFSSKWDLGIDSKTLVWFPFEHGKLTGRVPLKDGGLAETRCSRSRLR